MRRAEKEFEKLEELFLDLQSAKSALKECEDYLFQIQSRQMSSYYSADKLLDLQREAEEEVDGYKWDVQVIKEEILNVLKKR